MSAAAGRTFLLLVLSSLLRGGVLLPQSEQVMQILGSKEAALARVTQDLEYESACPCTSVIVSTQGMNICLRFSHKMVSSSQVFDRYAFRSPCARSCQGILSGQVA